MSYTFLVGCKAASARAGQIPDINLHSEVCFIFFHYHYTLYTIYVTIDIIVPENSFNKLLLDYSIVNCKQTGHSLILS